MILKLITLLTILQFSSALENNQDWDLALAAEGRIKFLLSNGTMIGETKDGFTKLKALAFDAVRHVFIVSDMDTDTDNDTIYAIDLTKETDSDPIITDLPDDVQGLAVDPIDDVLYWTDSKNHTINFLSLRTENPETQILFSFTEAIPQDITIDVCRRYIYWTNSFRKNPTIERAKIGSPVREVIVNADLGMPAGITVDYRTQRIYWTDIRGGIYYRIESTNLEGKERRVVYEGTHVEPFSVAVKDEHLYFTDLRSNALWKINLTDTTQPIKITNFEEKPMGLIAKKKEVKNLPDCEVLEEAYKNYTQSVTELLEKFNVANSSKEIECVNGFLENGVCKCKKGFSGVHCELSLCHNYCLVGSCHFTKNGYPYCHCPKDLGGMRCEKDCDGYCMNGGSCSFSFPNARLPTCTCPKGFSGARCEVNIISEKLCGLFCNEPYRKQSYKEEYAYCKCSNNDFVAIEDTPESLSLTTDSSSNYFSYLHDPVFIAMGCVTSFALIACVILTMTILFLRRRPSPRIKRRYIVNKAPSTSMTQRPQHPEQCEITIENCCNMNVCETPCFEPSRLQGYQQSRSEDKKTLLSHMERAED